MRAATVLLCLLTLTGCTLFESPADRALKASPDYRVGYSDGCASANGRGANMRASGLVRDEDAYRSNKAYRTGWGMGLGACRASRPGAPSTDGPSTGGLIPDREPGAPPL